MVIIPTFSALFLGHGLSPVSLSLTCPHSLSIFLLLLDNPQVIPKTVGFSGKLFIKLIIYCKRIFLNIFALQLFRILFSGENNIFSFYGAKTIEISKFRNLILWNTESLFDILQLREIVVEQISLVTLTHRKAPAVVLASNVTFCQTYSARVGIF